VAADGFADDDKVPLAGGTMTGPLNLQGSPPFTLVQGAFIGSLTLTGTTPVSVSASQITSASSVFLTVQPGGSGTAGHVTVASVTPGTGFTAVSSSASDVRVVAWMIVSHA
jgi:hypothetical protein